MEKKIYKKPEMQVYDMQMTKILCGSNDGSPYDYPRPFN